MKTNDWKRLNRLTACCLFVALAPLTLDGCVSVGVERTAPPAEVAIAPKTGALEARLYDTGSSAKKGVKSPREVSWKLFLLSKSSDTLVREGAGNVWNATDLEPGKYRLVATWGPAPGVAGDTSAGTTDDTFKLAAGETASARVIVKKFPTGWVIGIGAVVVVSAAVGIATASALGGLSHMTFSLDKSPSPADPSR